jgi:hypothetical protein
MQAFFESLEGRTFLSAVPQTASLNAKPQSTAAISAPITALAVLPKVTGKWNGTIKVTGVHNQPVTLNITKQTSKGALSGTLTTSADPSIKVAFTGTVKADSTFTVKLVGSHSGGAINGTGKGKLASTKKSVTVTMTWTQGGFSLPGSLVLKKA